MIFTLEQKIAALAMRFYQKMPWEPKVGDYYCLTREGTELFVINRTDGENFYIRRVYAPDQPEGSEMSDPWPIESFQSGFGENRVWVHPVILERMRSRFEHQGPCVKGTFGHSLILKDGTKVCINRGEGAESAHVWLSNPACEIVTAQ